GPKRRHDPGGLQSIRDNLYCHLYDETVVDLLEDDRQRTTNIHQRMERHWLGSLAIPFASLYANSRVEGTFKLYSPPVVWATREGTATHIPPSRDVSQPPLPIPPIPSAQQHIPHPIHYRASHLCIYLAVQGSKYL
ncbi:coiled-coil and C2 domain-containing protein 2A-like, partial [Nilaparvata lugens]|uniref:coiled-coil and C2 domain-containing protein 2A-like n=1 Tax=Nilaparvata lugens TaxID=108931 RepID=UPI00193CA138